MNRPRVTATYELPAETFRAHGGRQWTPPDVLVTVGFDLHEHEGALKALERAVADVRAQIEETSNEGEPDLSTRSAESFAYSRERCARCDHRRKDHEDDTGVCTRYDDPDCSCPGFESTEGETDD